jgi:hypothetical protein
VGFTIHPVKTFGDVEDDIGPDLAELLREILFCLEADNSSQARESGFNRGDRGGTIPLRELVAGDQLGNRKLSFRREVGFFAGGPLIAPGD